MISNAINEMNLAEVAGQSPRPIPTAQKSILGYGDYVRFRDLVLECSGLYFPERKRSDLEAGLRKALTASTLVPIKGYYDLEDYYHLLQDKTNPAGQVELERLINTLTVGETYFFRDEAQFSALATVILPELIRRKRAAAAAIGPNCQPQLRIWSAGCSSGEEAYSLAILLKELLPDIANWQILILATDINQESVLRAREALYSEWSFREPRARALRSTYFQLATGSKRYRLRNDVREMVTFAPLNLIADEYPAIYNNTVSMDLILCRNVTIYFAESDTRQVVDRFYRSLVHEGWLIVGHAEPSLLIYRAFQACSFPHAVLYQKTGQPTNWPTDWRLDDGLEPVKESALGCLTQSPIADQHQRHTPAKFQRTDSILPGNPAKPDPDPASIVPDNSQTDNPELEPVLSSADIVQNRYQLALTMLDQGQVRPAITSLQELVVTDPQFIPAYSLLGRAYANLNRWDQAKRWCQQALALDNLHIDTYYVLALVYQQEDQLTLAIQMFNKIIYLDRRAPLPHFNLALLYKKLGLNHKAYRACRNLIHILEKWPPETIVPDSGGTSAKYLLDITHQLWGELESEGHLI